MKTELKEKMMDVALEHIYKVNADPDVEFEDVDAYDAWIRFDKDWDLFFLSTLSFFINVLSPLRLTSK